MAAFPSYWPQDGQSPDAGQEPQMYPTLKRSLSAASSIPSGSRRQSVAWSSSHSVLHGSSEEHGIPDPVQSPLRFHSPPPSVAQIAFAALQCLPTPLLVLSSSKTVVLANEAFAILLCLESVGNEGMPNLNVQGEGCGILDWLRGLSLSDIAIVVDGDGKEAWIGWENYLDELADSCEMRQGEQAGKPQKHDGSATGSQLESHVCKAGQGFSPPALNTVIKVRILPQYLSRPLEPNSREHRSQDPGKQLGAEMVVSVWTLYGQRYFTLTFTYDAGRKASPSGRQSSQLSRRMQKQMIRSMSSPVTLTCSSASSSHLTPATTLSYNEVPYILSPLPDQPPSKNSRTKSAPTEFEKLRRMQDLMLDAMDVPVIGMWTDETVVTINKALARLTYHGGADVSVTDAFEVLSRFKVYNEDFTRLIDPAEYPIVQACRSRDSQSPDPSLNYKIGIIDSFQRRKIFEFTVDSIYDDETKELQGALVVLKDVTWYTDQMKAQSDQSEQQFQLICETLPQMLWTSKADGTYDYFSPRWAEYTGKNMEDLIGMAELCNVFHIDDRANSLKKWYHCLATGDPFKTEVRCRRHDGEWRWMQGRAMPSRDAFGVIIKWFGSYTDIHEVVEAQVEAKRTREHLSNVIRHAQVTVWAINTDHIITLMEGNSMWSDETPESMKRSIGQDIYVAFGSHKEKSHKEKESWNGYKELVERILRGEIPEWTSEQQMVEGNGRWYRTRLSPLLVMKTGQQNGHSSPRAIEGLIGVSVDVTEVKEAERDLKSQEAENMRLQAAEHAARVASKLKSQFLANMSHEIRTPIAGVIGMSELLLDTELSVEQREWTESIQHSANGLLTVINDILDLSKVESGKLDIEEVPFSLSVVVQDVCKMLSYAAERKNLDFRSNIDDNIRRNLVLLGDPGRIRQILTNLLTNSIKFTSEGYVNLIVSIMEEVHELVKISFAIEDTGIGIEEEVQKRLFKPFSQADRSTARKFGGTGLGLTICKNLIDLMHGEIRLESEIGQGTTTTFWVPFHRATTPEASSLMKIKIDHCIPSSHHLISNPASVQPVQKIEHMEVPKMHRMNASEPTLLVPPTTEIVTQVSSSKEQDRKNIKVLVVEDNAVNQKIAVKTIQKFGFTVHAVWNGKEALDYLLDVANPKPDVILMDCQMPILDGYKATHLIRHHSPYSSIASIRMIPIIAMTASAIQGDREKCTSAGMDDYLAKPVKGPLLENMILKWAVESKKKLRATVSYKHGHSDHASICTTPSSIHRSDPSASDESSNNNEEHRASESSNAPPAMSIRKPRGFLNIDAREEAASLRDRKLLTATESDANRRHINIPRFDPNARQIGPVTPLTFENISLLSRELEINPFDVWTTHNQEFCDGESVAEGTSSAANPRSMGGSPWSPMTVSKNKPEPMRLEIRRRPTRNESSMTVRQRLSSG